GVTDDEWHLFLSGLKPDELNFWKPSPRSNFTALRPGEFFLFKLHSPRNYIVGGGVFSSYSVLPISMAWDAFGEKNGAPLYEVMRAQILGHRSDKIGEFEDFDIGCIILTQPFFFPEEDWFQVPEWSREIVTGKTYTLDTPGGRQIWKDLSSALQKYREFGLDQEMRRIEEESPQYGKETVIHPRLGQGAFKISVTDAYSRSCAISEEHALPALEAAHIKPYSLSGPHQVKNGLLLRSDIHRLFDKGYITVTPDYHVEVSRRLKDDFKNGRYYYPFHGSNLANLPRNQADLPSKEFLIWHNDNVFR
ncbi:MAG: HNH endonuclease, partial [Candidatus Omnitrophica bacterium]|nr:HNH endonuclease [Candidatus Omnitrophota bacterium]